MLDKQMKSFGTSSLFNLSSKHDSYASVENNTENQNPTVVKCMLIGDNQVGKTSLVVSYTANGYPDQYIPSVFDKYNVELCADSRPVHLQICDTGGKNEVCSLRQLTYPDIHIIMLCFSVIKPDSFRSLKTNWLNELANAAILLNPSAQRTVAKLNETTKDENFVRKKFPSDTCQPARESCDLLMKQKSKSVLIKHPEMMHQRDNLKPVQSKPIPSPAFLLIGCACDLRNDITRLIELSKRGEEPVSKETAEALAIEIGAEAYVECSALTQKNLKTVFDLAVWVGLRIVDSNDAVKPICYSFTNGKFLAKNHNLRNANSLISSNNTEFVNSSLSLTPKDNIQADRFIRTNNSLPKLIDYSNEYCQKKSGWRRLFCMK